MAESCIFDSRLGDDGTWLASGGDETIRIWQMPAGLVREDVKDVAFSPDGEALAVAAETVVQLWQVSQWPSLVPNSLPKRGFP